MSSRDGRALRSSSWTPAMIIPGVQKPHWRPWHSQNPCWTGWRSPFFASPSMVVTSAPSAWTASIVHDFTAWPSTSTVHAPQREVSQPTWVPVSPQTSRRNWTSRSRGSTSRSVLVPLTRTVIFIRKSLKAAAETLLCVSVSLRPHFLRLLADLALRAQAVDREIHHVAFFEVDRVRLLAEADAGRRARRDDVARLEHHELAQVPDEMLHVEDHRLGVAGLAADAVHVEREAEHLGVGNLVGRDQPRAERIERLASLALVPGAALLELELALRDVVRDAVSGDDRQRQVLARQV